MLAWGINVNAVDKDGNTPLHLAVKQAENFPNTRSIKELLIKGAERTNIDIEGKKPIDNAVFISDQKLKAELEILLVNIKL